MQQRIYLDHNASTPLDPQVLEAMMQFYRESFGNPSSLHAYGRTCRQAIEEARKNVAQLIGAVDPLEIVFTSGGSEADNMAIKGICAARSLKGRGHIITSHVEHPAILATCEAMGKQGIETTYLPVDAYGRVSFEAVEEAITPRTILITIMHANNEVGTLQPLAQIGRIARKHGIPFHSDGVQSAGKIPVNVQELQADLFSLSSHKIYGPQGVGALYIRTGTRMAALIHGGPHERNRRAGTENTAGILGFGVACALARERLEADGRRIAALRDSLQEKIIASIPEVKINGHPTLRIPNTLNVSFRGVEGEVLLMNLDLKGIAVSTGSACHSGSTSPSHVLDALDLSLDEIQGSLRLSLGRCNEESHIDAVVECLSEAVQRIRSLSPSWASSAAR